MKQTGKRERIWPEPLGTGVKLAAKWPEKRPRLQFHHYEYTSGFQSVWQTLCRGYVQGIHPAGKRIPLQHHYFLNKILQDGLLTHKFSQSLAALIGLSGDCAKIPELFCLAGLEILKSIPSTHMLVLQFYKNMFLACPGHQPEILLNFALYLVLRQCDVTEGLELLKSKSSLPRFSENHLHKAYIGQFEYVLWKHRGSENNDSFTEHLERFDYSVSNDEHSDEFGAKKTTRKVDFSAKHAIDLFEEVFAIQGVWDIFVPAYVDLLKRHEGVAEAKAFLESYRNKNPLNPNSHRYLYQFLKSHSFNDKDKKKALKDLIKLDPTSEYLPDLVDLKVKSDSKKSVIPLIFQKLDYAACMFDEETWKLLESYLIPKDGCEIDAEMKRSIKKCWKDRESWWPQYHFRVPRTCTLAGSDKVDVMLIKANIAEYFLAKDNDFSQEVRSKYGVASDSRTQEIESSPANERNMSRKRPYTDREDAGHTKRKKR